jgi:hypothetical protein
LPVRASRGLTRRLAVLALFALAPVVNAQGGGRLPDRLTSAEFWKLTSDISEPGGYFRIVDNFTSNEGEVGAVFTQLRQRNVFGGVYMGVGPEQNLSYIAAIKPQMAFITDIRRQAVMQHLLYKAVFEMSKDRADFISLLFSKPRPAGLSDTTPVQKLWDAYWFVDTDRVQGPKNYQLIYDRLTKTHGFVFDEDEKVKLQSVWNAFYQHGPTITTNGGPSGSALGFADLTGYSYDPAGLPQSFLSTEENYRTLKNLHDRNLIVAVSGDFGGPKAIRAIGQYVKDRGSFINAFYVSNVEQYLFGDGKQAAFYDNVRTLPMTDQTVFIRPYAMRSGTSGLPLCPMASFLRAAATGQAYTWQAAHGCPRG